MSDTSSLRGKRILITSYSYANFGGAALNAVELADQLREFGMKPDFFSYDVSGPLAKYIEKKFGKSILTDQVNNLSQSDDEMGITELRIEDYDYIWVGGNTIPISFLKQINSIKKLPKFIFVHMSPLVGFPLDAPLMPDFEEKVASKILSISKSTTTDNLFRILHRDTPIDYWPNPVPSEFKYLQKRSGNLRKIAVISSSHPSSDIMELGQILKQKNISVDYIGKFNKNIKVVDAEFYNEYDLIIGIGKNARYSMVCGVPVYIYGRFGGGGYINDKNLKLNESYNFSGRGFTTKNANTIAEEIVTNYQDALSFHQTNREKFIHELSLDNVAKRLFTELEQQDSVEIKFDKNHLNWLISMQINLIQRHNRTAVARNAHIKIEKLEFKIAYLEENNLQLKLHRNNLKKEVSNMYHSLSWKCTKPLRMANSIRRKISNKMSRG